jgi:hypothetical protein
MIAHCLLSGLLGIEMRGHHANPGGPSLLALIIHIVDFLTLHYELVGL